MKKYLAHFVYIVIIAALAIASRIKTSDLEAENLECKARAKEAQQMAEMAQNEAEMQTKRAEEAAAQALLEANRAQQALEDCSGK